MEEVTVSTQSKQCPRCKESKEYSDFYKSSYRNDRLSVYCKKCENVGKKKRSDEKKELKLYGII